MSMFSNLFHKNSATQAAPLATNPILLNANQMNNEFLHHNKTQLLNQQGSFVQQPIISQAPIAPVYQSTLPLQSSLLAPVQPSGLAYRRGGPYRQFRLRTHNWGSRTENGWSGFNNWKYLPQNLASWEPKNFILEELRAQHSTNRGLFQQAPLAYTAAPLASQPMLNAPLFAGSSSLPAKANKKAARKQRRGHHHGIRKSRAQAVLPVQSIGGGPAIATIAPAPMMVAPLAAPVAPIVATRALPVAAPLPAVATPVETIIRPTIVQETVRTDRILEVQPVVHRQIEQEVVNHIEKHITEAPAANMGGVVRLAPVVQQNTSTRVINEVTPVVHREVAVRQVERVEEHLTEHVVAPTQHTNSVQYEASPVVAAPIVAPISPIAVAPLAQSPTLLAPINAAPIHQTLTKAPILEETIRTDRVVEIQPVVHREVEQNVINHIEKHITEAPAPLMGGTVRMAPIVTETLNTRVIDEVQPVVHREIAVAQVDRVEEHLVERVVAPTQHTSTVVTEVAPLSSSPILMEKNLDNGLLLKKNTYGSAMM